MTPNIIAEVKTRFGLIQVIYHEGVYDVLCDGINRHPSCSSECVMRALANYIQAVDFQWSRKFNTDYNMRYNLNHDLQINPLNKSHAYMIMHRAVSDNNYEKLKEAINGTASNEKVNLYDEKAVSSVKGMIFSSNVKMLDFLLHSQELENRFDVHHDNDIIFRTAIDFDKPEIIKYLLALMEQTNTDYIAHYKEIMIERIKNQNTMEGKNYMKSRFHDYFQMIKHFEARKKIIEKINTPLINDICMDGLAIKA
jgi:hypothetical protein